MDLFLLTICLLAIIASFLAIEEEDSITSILILLVFTITIGILLIYMEAIYAGIFHLLIYSGAITVIFALLSYYSSPAMEVTA